MLQQTFESPANADLNRGAKLALILGLGILILKGTAYFLTSSTAVLSDALESIVNVITAGTALFVIRLAFQPADKGHPYGHGKAEYVSAAFEGGLVFFAAIAIVFESIKALYYGPELQRLDIGIVLMVLAASINLVLGLYLKKISQNGRSHALAASSAHILSDVKTTFGVLVGLGLVAWTEISWLDPLVAIAIGGHLGYEGFKILRGSVGGLMDEVDHDALGFLVKAFQKTAHSEVIDIHYVRAIRSGYFHHIDAHLVLPEFWDLKKAHDFSVEYQNLVGKEYPFHAEFAFHFDPCRQMFCLSCMVADCPIRKESFVKKHEINLDSILKKQ